jgi:hypothetical protein
MQNLHSQIGGRSVVKLEDKSRGTPVSSKHQLVHYVFDVYIDSVAVISK